ncbi:hypothetical protein NC653_021472 [Populus alba x Populus x berolinensis]|uniref:Uncharacterized protein n=1 Tax=Populus alba x Populus x berolinensis TaxID=444605 RepID=A0AAD6MNC1_9ROSI|nr:hypothetical protein NC653_021472 [Populus alba x Populus x berolinensis]
MLSLGTSKGIFEIAKFGVYVTVPIVLMYSFASNTSNLQKFMGNVCTNDTEILFPFFLHVLSLSLSFYEICYSFFLSGLPMSLQTMLELMPRLGQCLI